MRKRSYSSSLDYLSGGSISFTSQSVDMVVIIYKGQLLRLALISNMVTYGMGKVTKVLPNVFLLGLFN